MIALALLLAAAPAPRPNVVLILADDLGFSDLGCYGGEIATPHLDALAAGGLRFTQFYNCGRCCPTRASLLSGLYPHQGGVGHMLGQWKPPAYTNGLRADAPTLAEVLKPAGYRSYHVGKWHVGGISAKNDGRNHPISRGFDRAYGIGGGGGFFKPNQLYRDRTPETPGDDYYTTDAFTTEAVKFLGEHDKSVPFFLHLCYTAPHFPLHARPADIAKYEGRYADGWDALRAERFARQQALGVMPAGTTLSPRDPEAVAWADVPAAEKADWQRRMAVHAAMVTCMDRGIGKVLEGVRRRGAEDNTLVLFLSDNGASAESLDSWPNPARGHTPGSVVGTAESHRCLEVGWANAANTPFREHKMWCHEGGVCTPLVARWPAGVAARGTFTPAAGHVLDFLPTLAELAGVAPPKTEGRSLLPALRGAEWPARTLAWEHEGNRAIRAGDWKLVASHGKPWELFDLATDRTETRDRAAAEPERAKQMAADWQTWADRVGVIPWEQLPGAKYKPTPGYRRKSER